MARAAQSAKRRRRVVGGVDTHADAHHAAVVTMHGRRLADARFPATEVGYAQMVAWWRSFGRVHTVGVEGSNAYGAGLARQLHAVGVRMVEVHRPDRAQRRLRGKSDPLDAYAAAESVLAQRATAAPKLGTGIVEAVRALQVTRAGAVKARTAAINELRSLLVTAPAELRDRLRGHSRSELIAACARLRPGSDLADPAQAVKQALRRLARRYEHLTAEITEATAQLTDLVAQACPVLLAEPGVGVETAAQLLITLGDNPDRARSADSFAQLCGVAPVPASSGRTDKHRLSRGGDRQANRALHMIIITRLRVCQRTRAYFTRRTQQGLTKKDIIRCLKRYLARSLYRLLTSANAPTSAQPAAA